MNEPLIDVDPSKLLGVRHTGLGVAAYKELLRYDPCAYCGRPYRGYRAELDHITAHARGGVPWHRRKRWGT